MKTGLASLALSLLALGQFVLVGSKAMDSTGPVVIESVYTLTSSHGSADDKTCDWIECREPGGVCSPYPQKHCKDHEGEGFPCAPYATYDCGAHPICGQTCAYKK